MPSAFAGSAEFCTRGDLHGVRVSIIRCHAQNEGPLYSRALHRVRISTQYYQHNALVLRTVTQASSASSEDLRIMEPCAQ